MFLNKRKFNLNNIAIQEDDDKKISYSELYERAISIEQYHDRRRLTCVVCDNSFETLVFIYQLLILKQPMILLSDGCEKEYYENVIGKFKPELMWHRKKLLEIETDNLDVMSLDNTLALLISTSGSVGNPQFVMLSYDNLECTAVAGADLLSINENHRGMLILPIEHILGMSFCLYHWLCGATIVLSTNSFFTKEFAELYSKEDINNFVGIPFIYKYMRKTGFWDNKNRVDNLNCAITAGANLDCELRNWCKQKLNNKFYNFYGQTETAGLAIADDYRGDIESFGFIGRCVNGVKASVTDDGELAIESGGVCMGYAYDYDDLCAKNRHCKYLLTGDIATIDEDGYICLIGRKRRFIKIKGHRYQLDQIENVINQELGDCEVVCTGTDDIINVYVLSNDKKVKKSILDILHEKIAVPTNMINVSLVNEIPKNKNGKIMYSKLEYM